MKKLAKLFLITGDNNYGCFFVNRVLAPKHVSIPSAATVQAATGGTMQPITVTVSEAIRASGLGPNKTL